MASVGDDLWSRDGGDEFPGTNTSRNTTSAWEGLMGGNYQEVGLRLEVVPNAFGARQAMANIRNKRLQMAREHEVLRIKEEMLVFTLQDALGLLESHYEQVRLKLNELEYADHSSRQLKPKWTAVKTTWEHWLTSCCDIKKLALLLSNSTIVPSANTTSRSSTSTC